jgi:predicted RNA-binding Zn ribbon-like protein
MAGTNLHHFKLLGGHAVLDFINTVHGWNEKPLLDYLGDFGDALRFGVAAGLLSQGDTRRLRDGDRSGVQELKRLKELRLLLKRICENYLTRKLPSKEDLQILSAAFGDVARATQFVALPRTSRSRFTFAKKVVIPEAAGRAILRFKVIEAAVELLCSHSMSRLKSCPTCGWFFIDSSKNGSRRWCSMRACGSVAKARRYYRRKKVAGG